MSPEEARAVLDAHVAASGVPAEFLAGPTSAEALEPRRARQAAIRAAWTKRLQPLAEIIARMS